MYFLKLFVLVFLAVFCSLTFGITAEEVLAKAAEKSSTYDFEAGERSMFSSVAARPLKDFTNGRLSRTVQNGQTIYRGDFRYRSQGTIGMQFIGSPTESYIYVEAFNKYAVKLDYNKFPSSIMPLIGGRFDTLQAILDNSEQLVIDEFDFEYEKNKIPCYRIKLDISSSAAIQEAFPEAYRKRKPAKVDLIIGKKDFFVYAWLIQMGSNKIIDINDLGDAKVYPAGTLELNDFVVPEKCRVLVAKDIEDFRSYVASGGLTKKEQRAQANARFWNRVGDFFLYKSKYIGLFFGVLGFAACVVAWIIKRKRSIY